MPISQCYAHLPPIPGPDPLPAGLLTSQGFQKWFQDSMAVDAQGAPIIVYHGTSRPDRAFSTSRHHDLEGAYFTSDFDLASEYAHMDAEIDGDEPYVICAFLQLRNPKVMTGMDSYAISTAQRAEMEAQGHDGVVGMYEDYVFEYVVFDPSQIAAWHQGSLEIPLQPKPAAIKPKPQQEESGLSL